MGAQIHLWFTQMRKLRMNLFISRLNRDHWMISSSLLYWGGPSVTDFTFGSTTFGSSFFSSFLSSIVLRRRSLHSLPLSLYPLLSLLRSSSHSRSSTCSSFCTSHSLLLRSKYSVLDQPLSSSTVPSTVYRIARQLLHLLPYLQYTSIDWFTQS